MRTRIIPNTDTFYAVRMPTLNCSLSYERALNYLETLGSGFFIFNFEHILQLFVVILLLTLRIYLFPGINELLKYTLTKKESP